MTFSVSQEKAGAGNICFLQTNLCDVGGLGGHPLLTHWAEPWEAQQGSQSLTSATGAAPGTTVMLPRGAWSCPSFSIQDYGPWGQLTASQPHHSSLPSVVIAKQAN